MQYSAMRLNQLANNRLFTSILTQHAPCVHSCFAAGRALPSGDKSLFFSAAIGFNWI